MILAISILPPNRVSVHIFFLFFNLLFHVCSYSWDTHKTVEDTTNSYWMFIMCLALGWAFHIYHFIFTVTSYISLLYSEWNEARELKQLVHCHTARIRMGQIWSVREIYSMMQPLHLFLNLFISRQWRSSILATGNCISSLIVLVKWVTEFKHLPIMFQSLFYHHSWPVPVKRWVYAQQRDPTGSCPILPLLFPLRPLLLNPKNIPLPEQYQGPNVELQSFEMFDTESELIQKHSLRS